MLLLRKRAVFVMISRRGSQMFRWVQWEANRVFKVIVRSKVGEKLVKNLDAAKKWLISKKSPDYPN